MWTKVMLGERVKGWALLERGENSGKRVGCFSTLILPIYGKSCGFQWLGVLELYGKNYLIILIISLY